MKKAKGKDECEQDERGRTADCKIPVARRVQEAWLSSHRSLLHLETFGEAHNLSENDKYTRGRQSITPDQKSNELAAFMLSRR